jgi:hypothetical protein
MKTCLLLFKFVSLNFRNFYKLVWVNLDQIWKGYKRNKKAEKEKEEKRKKNRNRPRGSLSATAHLEKPKPVPLFSLTLADVRAPPARATSSSSSLVWISRRRPSFPADFSRLIPLNSCLFRHTSAHIKSPSTPSPFFASFLYGLRRRAGEIPRRSMQVPATFSAHFRRSQVSPCPICSPKLLPLIRRILWSHRLSKRAVNRCQHQLPKVTVAWSCSGRPSSKLLEEINAADLASILAASTCASSTLPRRQKTTGEPSPSTTWAALHREAPAGTLAGEISPPFPSTPSDLDPVVHNRPLNRSGINWSWPCRLLKIRRLASTIRANRYQPLITRHVASHWLVWFSN